MGYIEGVPRDQTIRFPDTLDEYISGDNPVRFIDAYVDHLDLDSAGFGRTEPAETGRPAYQPGDLLKLYIYGYLQGIRSSRKLETESKRNVELMWLLGKLSPDHKTIADFRRDNRTAFKQVFRNFCLLCRKLELFASPSPCSAPRCGDFEPRPGLWMSAAVMRARPGDATGCGARKVGAFSTAGGGGVVWSAVLSYPVAPTGEPDDSPRLATGGGGAHGG